MCFAIGYMVLYSVTSQLVLPPIRRKMPLPGGACTDSVLHPIRVIGLLLEGACGDKGSGECLLRAGKDAGRWAGECSVRAITLLLEGACKSKESRKGDGGIMEGTMAATAIGAD